MKINFGQKIPINPFNPDRQNPQVGLSMPLDSFVRSKMPLIEQKEFNFDYFFNDDFLTDEELKIFDPQDVKELKETIVFNNILQIFCEKSNLDTMKKYRGSKSLLSDVFSPVDEMPGASEFVCKKLMENGVKTFGDLVVAINLLAKPNIQKYYHNSTLEFFEIYGDLGKENKKALEEFPGFLQYLRNVAQEKGYDDLHKLYTCYYDVFDCLEVRSLKEFKNKFNHLSEIFNNFENFDDYYEAIGYISHSFEQKMDLLDEITKKYSDDSILGYSENVYVEIPDVIDTIFLQNDGQSLGDFADFIDVAVESKKCKSKTFNAVSYAFNDFQSVEDKIDFYRYLKCANVSVSEANNIYNKSIISDLKDPVALIDNKDSIVNILSEKEEMNTESALDFYIKFADVLNVAYTSQSSDSDVLSDTFEFIKMNKFSNSEDILKFYNRCNGNKVKSLTSAEFTNFVDLFNFTEDNLFSKAGKKKLSVIDYLSQKRELFNDVKLDISQVLEEEKKIIPLKKDILSVFKKYPDIFNGDKSQIKNKLSHILYFGINEQLDYNNRAVEIEKFAKFFENENDLNKFICDNNISFDKSPTEVKYKENCFKSLNILYDESNKEQSLNRIKELSDSKFLAKSKNILDKMYLDVSEPKFQKLLFDVVQERKIDSYYDLDTFFKKYSVNKKANNELLSFVQKMPKNLNFNKIISLLFKIQEQVKSFNFPLKLNSSNIKNITPDELIQNVNKGSDFDVEFLNKLIGIPVNTNPVLSLPNAYTKELNYSRFKIASELLGQDISLEEYPKINKLLNTQKVLKTFSKASSLTITKNVGNVLPQELYNFINSMGKTDFNKYYNMSLHSKMRIIERFLMDDIKEINDFNRPEVKEKLNNLLDSIYNQKQNSIKKRDKSNRLLFNSIYNGKVIETVFTPTGLLITAVEKTY